jgi:hypothetical protein
MSERGSFISHASGSTRITAQISPFAFVGIKICAKHINRTNNNYYSDNVFNLWLYTHT